MMNHAPELWLKNLNKPNKNVQTLIGLITGESLYATL